MRNVYDNIPQPTMHDSVPHEAMNRGGKIGTTRYLQIQDTESCRRGNESCK